LTTGKNQKLNGKYFKRLKNSILVEFIKTLNVNVVVQTPNPCLTDIQANITVKKIRLSREFYSQNGSVS